MMLDAPVLDVDPRPGKAGALSQEVVNRAIAGDEAAWTEVYERLYTPLRNYVARLMHTGPEDAADLTHDTFVKALGHRRQLRGAVNNLHAWLYRIATNVCLDELRHRRLLHWRCLDTPLVGYGRVLVDPEPLPEEVAEGQEVAGTVMAATGQLYHRYRDVVGLRLRERSYDEIAAALDTTRASVKSLLFRAREELRQDARLRALVTADAGGA